MNTAIQPISFEIQIITEKSKHLNTRIFSVTLHPHYCSDIAQLINSITLHGILCCDLIQTIIFQYTDGKPTSRLYLDAPNLCYVTGFVSKHIETLFLKSHMKPIGCQGKLKILTYQQDVSVWHKNSTCLKPIRKRL